MFQPYSTVLSATPGPFSTQRSWICPYPDSARTSGLPGENVPRALPPSLVALLASKPVNEAALGTVPSEPSLTSSPVSELGATSAPVADPSLRSLVDTTLFLMCLLFTLFLV